MQVVPHHWHVIKRSQGTGEAQLVKTVQNADDLLLMLLYKDIGDLAGVGTGFVTHNKLLPSGSNLVTLESAFGCGYAALGKDVNSCCATGPFISGTEHWASLCCASLPVPSTLYGLSVRRLISFDRWLPSHETSRFRSCFGLVL